MFYIDKRKNALIVKNKNHKSRLFINTSTCKGGPDAWNMATMWFDVISAFWVCWSIVVNVVRDILNVILFGSSTNVFEALFDKTGTRNENRKQFLGIQYRVVWRNVGYKFPVYSNVCHIEMTSDQKAAMFMHLFFHCERICAAQPAWYPFDISYPFIMTEGSSVSTQAAELTKRFSGGRDMLFPATFLKTTIITVA